VWNLPNGNKFLPTIPLKKLEKLYREENDEKARTRLLAAVWRKQNKSVDKIAKEMRKKKPTVHDWLTKFNKIGIEAKKDPKRQGKRPLLTDKQRKDLVRRLEKGPTYNPNGLWTSKEVLILIQKQYNITYVPQHIWRILQSLGFTIQRPRKKHYKSASIEEIKRFKKTPDKNHCTTERKVLLWPQKTRQHSA